MGSSQGHVDELPVHEVKLDGFWCGKYEVTVEQFRKFTEATGYKTDAELEGTGLVLQHNQWMEIKSFNWKNGFNLKLSCHSRYFNFN